MSDTPDPPRKFYGLKPREFEVVNPPAAASGESGQKDQPIDVHDLFRSASLPGKVLSGSPGATRENDVHGLLRDNLAKANAAGLNDLAPKPPRKSRRARDYVLVLIAGNLLFVGAIFWRPNVVVIVSAGAGMILLTLSLTWVMWVLMDDY